MKVTITVDTGNEAMRNGVDVRMAILCKLQVIEDAVDDGDVRQHGKILDTNGNSVGLWKVTGYRHKRRHICS